MKNGFRAFDSDMHVHDAADLYVKYMNPKWGERIPRRQRNGRHGRVEFKLGGGKQTLRAITDVVKRLGDDNILISTDYPHIDAHFPHALDKFFDIKEVSDASRRKILWDNCARLYGDC